MASTSENTLQKRNKREAATLMQEFFGDLPENNHTMGSNVKIETSSSDENSSDSSSTSGSDESTKSDIERRRIADIKFWENILGWASTNKINYAAFSDLLQLLKEKSLYLPKEILQEILARKYRRSQVPLKSSVSVPSSSASEVHGNQVECNISKQTKKDNLHENPETPNLIRELRTFRFDMQKKEQTTQNLLQKLTEEIKALRNEVKQLKANSLPTEAVNNSIDNKFVEEILPLPTLPFYSLSEFVDFDKKMIYDEKSRSKLKYVIKQLNDGNMATFLRSAIKSVISDELAVEMTWKGTNYKPSIQQFCTFNIIKESCHMMYQTASSHEINKICQQHLLHASDRLKKRKKLT